MHLYFKGNCSVVFGVLYDIVMLVMFMLNVQAKFLQCSYIDAAVDVGSIDKLNLLDIVGMCA